MHHGSDESLKRFQEAAAGDRVTREAYLSLNIYIFACQNTRVCANNLLRRCERIIRILWQSRDARNTLIPAFEEHPERRLKDYLDAIQDYIRDSELPNGEGPYGSTVNLFRASVTHVARRTIGTLPDAEITILRKTYALRALEFTPAAAKLLEYPIMDAAISTTEDFPTGSSLSR